MDAAGGVLLHARTEVWAAKRVVVGKMGQTQQRWRWAETRRVRQPSVEVRDPRRGPQQGVHSDQTQFERKKKALPKWKRAPTKMFSTAEWQFPELIQGTGTVYYPKKKIDIHRQKRVIWS